MSRWLCSLNLIVEIDDGELENADKIEEACQRNFVAWLEENNLNNIAIEVVERVDE